MAVSLRIWFGSAQPEAVEGHDEQVVLEVVRALAGVEDDARHERRADSAGELAERLEVALVVVSATLLVQRRVTAKKRFDAHRSSVSLGE